MNGCLLWQSRISSDWLPKNLFAKTLFAEYSILGMSTAWSSACNSEAIAAIYSPSERSSTSIVSFNFHCYCCETMSATIPDSIWSRKPAQSCDCAAFCHGLYGSDIMAQATNWLADGCVLRLVRHALTALSIQWLSACCFQCGHQLSCLVCMVAVRVWVFCF